jgi:hypothetical protein
LALEDRCVPATLPVLKGLLTYSAGAGVANNLKIAVVGTNYVFTDTGETITAPGLPGSRTHGVTIHAGVLRLRPEQTADQGRGSRERGGGLQKRASGAIG